MKSPELLYQPVASLALITTALALAACGSESPHSPPPASAPETVSQPASAPLPEGDVVAATLEGHLEQVTADGVQPFSFHGRKPQFYLLYYTASW